MRLRCSDMKTPEIPNAAGPDQIRTFRRAK
jgi:hypothetical protein